MKFLNEDSRGELISQSKRADLYNPEYRDKGKNRHQRRLKSKIARSNKEFNQIDMNKLFKEDLLDFNIRVYGETDVYLVRLKFKGFLNELRGYLPQEPVPEDVDFRAVTRALTSTINHSDIQVHCTCADFKYRDAFWCTINGTNAGDPERRPSDETNPNDTKGFCKHINLVLNNTSWCAIVASVIRNYIRYMQVHQEDLYNKVIYPAIFDREYVPVEEEPEIQKDELDDIQDDNLDTDKDTIDISNKWNKAKSQFQKGNQSGIQFAKPEKEFDIDSIEDEENLDTAEAN